MDEYVEPSVQGFGYISPDLPHSCRRFARESIVQPLSSAAREGRGIRPENVWVPDPDNPEEYDRRLERAGGVDLFTLASGASRRTHRLQPARERPRFAIPPRRTAGAAPPGRLRPDPVIEPSGVGVAVVAGTGPAVAGRGPTRREWSASWWILEPLGAGGLGDRALHAVYRHALGLGPDTALTASLLQLYGYDAVEQLRHAFTQRVGSRPWQDKAQAARVVHGLAAAGDAVAVEIVRTQAAHLAEYAKTAAVRVGFTPGVDAVPVALSGSVLTAEASPLAEELVRALQVELPGAVPVVTSLPPVAGAVLDAMAEAGVALTPEVVEALRETMPAADLLRT
ncbi:hypothetical protein ACWCOV_08580 [Kribbella sp. NPDC002412]